MYIYKITNKINSKCYIGQTTQDVNIRFKQHCKSYSKCTLIARAIKKYGKENFTIEEIGGANSQSELNYLEWLTIKKENSSAPCGYNLAEGGLAKGKTHASTKIKIGNIHRGKILSDETKEKLRQCNLGKTLSQDTKKKIGNSHRGQKRSQSTCNNISLSNRKDKRMIYCVNNDTYYNSAAEAGKLLDLDNCCISKVLSGRRNHYKGYIFIYKDKHGE